MQHSVLNAVLQLIQLTGHMFERNAPSQISYLPPVASEQRQPESLGDIPRRLGINKRIAIAISARPKPNGDQALAQ